MPHAQSRTASSPPFRGVGPFRPVALGVVALLAAFGPPPAAASTVVVPDDSSTVQSAIDSGADTVSVREGNYAEAPLVERNLVLRGIGIARRPRLAGLMVTNRDRPSPDGSSVSGFDVSGTVTYQNAANKSPIWVNFSDCSMDNGLLVYANDPDAHCMLTLSRCHLPYASGGLDYISMEADTLDSGVSWSLWGQSAVFIQNCWFKGATGAAITISRETSGTIAHNRIENYAVSVSAPEATLTMDGNTISGCGTGIDVRAEAYVTNNVIRGCGVGIYCTSYGSVRLINNTILNASSDGINVQAADDLGVGGNIVGSCGGNGIVIWGNYSGQYYDVSVQNNTIFNNRGSGVVWGVQPPTYSAMVQNNISFANASWGLTAQPGTRFSLGCNDWFGNDAGATSGVAKDSTDLSVDPMFCDVAGADVRLNSASPLLNVAGCGQIGALGVGCGVTPTLVQRFTAGRVSVGIRVIWEVEEGATATAIWVERAEGLNGQAWTQPVMERSIEGGTVVELDRSALPDRTYWYRLVARDGGKVTVLDPGILVEAQARLAFGLVEVGPSPGSGPVRIAFSLASASAIEIDVFDIQGRRVASPAHGTWPAGTQEVAWDGRTRSGQSAPAGLYLVRYRYPGGQDRRRIVRVQ